MTTSIGRGFLAVNKTPRILLLCSPQNPIGRIWKKEELIEVGKFCFLNNMILIVDEVHCDLLYPGEKFCSFGSLDPSYLQNVIILNSPTKTFNFTGLRGGNAIIYNKAIMDRLSTRLMRYCLKTVNTFYIAATITSYKNCEYWLDNLMRYISENFDLVYEFIQSNIPQLAVGRPQATFLILVDYRKLSIDENFFIKRLSKKLLVIEGSKFGSSSVGFFRMNIAIPRLLLLDALKALHMTINEFDSE